MSQGRGVGRLQGLSHMLMVLLLSVVVLLLMLLLLLLLRLRLRLLSSVAHGLGNSAVSDRHWRCADCYLKVSHFCLLLSWGHESAPLISPSALLLLGDVYLLDRPALEGRRTAEKNKCQKFRGELARVGEHRRLRLVILKLCVTHSKGFVVRSFVSEGRADKLPG